MASQRSRPFWLHPDPRRHWWSVLHIAQPRALATAKPNAPLAWRTQREALAHCPAHFWALCHPGLQVHCRPRSATGRTAWWHWGLPLQAPENPPHPVRRTALQYHLLHVASHLDSQPMFISGLALPAGGTGICCCPALKVCLTLCTAQCIGRHPEGPTWEVKLSNQALIRP